MNTLLAIPGNTPLQLAYYRCGEFQRMVDKLARGHDGVIAHLIRTGQYALSTDVPVILEMTDAISLNYERMKSSVDRFSLKKFIYAVERRRLFQYERSAVTAFDRTWLVSDVDRAYLTDRNEEIEIIANGVDTDGLAFRPRLGGDTVAFIGNMTTAQNEDACMHFIKDILPKLRDRAAIRFRIVGNISSRLKNKFVSYPGVEATGRLGHIADGLEGCFCAVCPVRAAAGIQNKVLEYLALGLPCVTSRVGLEGIDAMPGKDLLVYDTAEEAADEIIALHSDSDLSLRIATSGRNLVMRNYDWERVYDRFIQSVSNVLTSTNITDGNIDHATADKTVAVAESGF